MADREPRNRNRLDLYRRLLQKIIEFDQESGAQGHIAHWDDPEATWDSGDVRQAWDAIGLSPVIQELFHVIETMAGEDLEVLESLDALVDPLRCPESLLPQIAASFGYALDETQGEDRKRQAVLGLLEAYKAIGRFVGFKVFYRLIGFQVIDIYPLWKKEANESQYDYSRERFSTSLVPGEPVGPAGLSGYSGQIAEPPVKPGTVRFTDGATVIRDDMVVQPEVAGDRAGYGDLLGPSGKVGTFNYGTGEFTVNLPAPTAGAFVVDYEHVDEEWPYHAARIDLEINLSPGGVPIPLLDYEGVEDILRRFDEIRPIHVLLRSLALVAEVRDEVEPTASDQAACLTKLKNVLEGTFFPGTPGLDHTYMLSGALDFASDEMSIYEAHTSGTDVHHQPMEDDAPLVCPLDKLIIEGPPGGPYYV